jgi:hypothetical protein
VAVSVTVCPKTAVAADVRSVVVVSSGDCARFSRPIALLGLEPVLASANQMLPSGPTAMPKGFDPVVMPAANSVNAPAVVRRPIRPLPPNSVNQRLPSGPVVISKGVAPTMATSVMTPAGVIRPITPKFASVNQRLPSGPVVIPLT